MLNIGGLQEGVVIDHIKAGGSMEIYHYLELEKLDCSVAIIKNAKSSKMGKRYYQNRGTDYGKLGHSRCSR